MLKKWILPLFLLAACGGSTPVRKAKYWKKTVYKTIRPGRLVRALRVRNSVLIRYERMQVRARYTGEKTLRLQAEWGNRFTQRPSYAVVKISSVEPLFEKTNGNLVLKHGPCSLAINPEPLSLVLSVSGKTVFATTNGAWYLLVKEEQVFRNETFHRILSRSTNFCFEAAGGARYFGLGEKTGPMELTGRAFEFWNSDTYKYKKDTDPIYTSIPFYHALAGDASYSLFTESMARGSIRFDKTVRFGIDGKRLDHYIFPGKPQETLPRYTALTGRPAMPPLWALGFHQSRYSYMSRHEVQTVVSNFRRGGLPLDAVYLDLGFMDRNRSFTHNRKTYPDPAAMNRLLRSLGVRTVAIVDPGIAKSDDYPVYVTGKRLDVFVKRGNRDYIGRVWPGNCVFPDVTHPRARRWWGGLYRDLLGLGIAGFWNDMNEPSVFGAPGGTMHIDVRHHYDGVGGTHRELHNIYGLQLVRATYEGLRRLRPKERPFILTRAGYAGIQRYAFLWTGDNTADWDHLRMNLSMVLNLGLSGVPFSGADIGGYTGNPDPELFVRWIQLGTFMPFMRDHTEAGTKYQEPYVFREHLGIIRRYMRLRYRLLPYIYTLAREASRTGAPLVRPMFWEFGDGALDSQSQFMLGSALLVAPVLGKGKREKPVRIPAGLWYDLDGRLQYNTVRPQRRTVRAALSECPLLVRGGRIVPLADNPPLSSDGFGPKSGYTAVVCPDREGLASGSIHFDDSRYRGRSLRIRIGCQVAGDRATLVVEQEGTRGLFSGSMRFLLPVGVRKVRINGRPAVLDGRYVSLR